MIVIVETDYTFTEFDRFDPLLHYARGDIAFYHWRCEAGGDHEVQLLPMPYRRRLFMGWERHDFEGSPEAYQLVCASCGESVEHSGELMRWSLKRFLVGPEAETAPAQALGENDRFVPPGWPPSRRHRPDRRQTGGRYLKDRTMEGHRRLDHDRREDPDHLDTEPDAES